MTAGAAVEEGTPARGAGVFETLRGAPAPAKALLAGIFVNRLGGFLQIFLVLFLTARGHSATQAGFALGAYGAGSVAGVLVGGSLADRVGARATILTSMLGSAALVLAVLYVKPYPGILAAVIVVGAVGQIYRPAAASMLAELTPEDRQVMIFAMYRFALNLGTTAAPLIGAALVLSSYSLLFWGEAVAAAVYAVIAAVALPRRPAPAPAGPAAGAAEAGTPLAADTARHGYGAVLVDRRYLLYLLAMLINAAVYVQYLGTLPLAMKSAGLVTFWYGSMVALNGLIVISCELLVTKVVQRQPVRLVVTSGFLLLGAGYAAYALPGGLAVFFVGTLLWSLAEIVGGPTMFAYPASAGPTELRGRYLGAAHAMFGLGSAIGPAAGVALWTVLGNRFWLWCGGLSLFALLAAVRGVRPKAAAEPAPEAAGEMDAALDTVEDGRSA